MTIQHARYTLEEIGRIGKKCTAATSAPTLCRNTKANF